MKRLFLTAMALALSACAAGVPAIATSGTVPAPIVIKAGNVVLTGARAFAVAELAYITAADGVGKLADNGAITGATADRVRVLNAGARQLLVTGKMTADGAEKARAAAQLLNIADALSALIGRK